MQDLNDPKRVVRAAQDDQVLVAAPFHCDRVLLRTIGLKRRHMGATASTLEIMVYLRVCRVALNNQSHVTLYAGRTSVSSVTSELLGVDRARSVW